MGKEKRMLYVHPRHSLPVVKRVVELYCRAHQYLRGWASRIRFDSRRFRRGAAQPSRYIPTHRLLLFYLRTKTAAANVYSSINFFPRKILEVSIVRGDREERRRELQQRWKKRVRFLADLKNKNSLIANVYGAFSCRIVIHVKVKWNHLTIYYHSILLKKKNNWN